MASSLFFVKPAQNVVLLCAPQMSKLGEKVGADVQACLSCLSVSSAEGPPHCPRPLTTILTPRVSSAFAPFPTLCMPRQVVKHTRNVSLGTISWKKFPDGFPNIFVHDVESIKGCHVVFLASFGQVLSGCRALAQEDASLRPLSIHVLLHASHRSRLPEDEGESRSTASSGLTILFSGLKP
jgi:hypothetical protein